jgi:hypothetical protein
MPERGHRVLRIVGAVAIGLAATIAGLAALRYPVAGWLPELPRKSDVPPVIGAGCLVVPVVLVVVGVRRLVDALALRIEARHQRRSHAARHAAAKRPE